MNNRKNAARTALGWVEAWQVNPNQMAMTFDYLDDLEERTPLGAAEADDFTNFELPVTAVCAAINALCDGLGVERFDGYEAIAGLLSED